MTRCPETLLSLLLLVACGQGEDAPAPPGGDTPADVQASAPPEAGSPDDGDQDEATTVSWADELAALDKRIAFHQQRFTDKGSWLEAESAAGRLRQRARLTGDYADYSRAEAQLAEGFAVAPEGGGPLLGRARLHFTLHRLPQAEADLAVVDAQPILTASTKAALADLRADIALERGQLDTAHAHYSATEASSPTMQTASALARIAWLRGDFDSADALFDTALSRYHGKAAEPVAWVHLQRGLIDLDQGQPAAALAHYDHADAALSGYWLVEEHRAEALALTGQTEDALALYRDVVARTGSPELQGALAGLLLERGDEAEAQELIAQANATYAAQLERYPEAATGHALDHALEWGTDPQAALAMAERNAELRPSGAALAQLAEARLAAGDPSGALQAAERGLDTGTRSAGLFLAAAAAARATKDQEGAAKWLDEAVAIDPGSSLDH